MYNEHKLETDVHTDAGKHAKFSEAFMLPNIEGQTRVNGTIEFEAYDKDTLSSELLCAAEPIEYLEFCENQNVTTHNIDLLDKTGLIAGSLKFTT